eukprot:2054748-Prymnesium_polylepis.1
MSATGSPCTRGSMGLTFYVTGSTWPMMVYDAPCGGIGRYAPPAVPWLARERSAPLSLKSRRQIYTCIRMGPSCSQDAAVSIGSATAHAPETAQRTVYSTRRNVSSGMPCGI